MRLQVVWESLQPQALEMANIIRQDRRGVIAADRYEPTKEELQKFGRLDPIAAKMYVRNAFIITNNIYSKIASGSKLDRCSTKDLTAAST